MPPAPLANVTGLAAIKHVLVAFSVITFTTYFATALVGACVGGSFFNTKTAGTDSPLRPQLASAGSEQGRRQVEV